MADDEVTKELIGEMCWVQELIEKYIKLYMTKKEIVYVLSHGPEIGPGLTEIVWQNLERENKEFFRAYRISLAIMDQIEQFNNLLEKQAVLMSGGHPTSASTSLSTESQCPNDYLISQATLLDGPSGNLHQAAQTMHNVYADGSFYQPSMQVYRDMSEPGEMTDGLDNIVMVQNLHAEVMQGMNGDVIKSEHNTPLGGNIGLSECSRAFMQVPNSVYNYHELMNGPSMNSSGREDIPSNISLSDLGMTADFLTSDGVLESHYRSQIPDHTFEFPGYANQGTSSRHWNEQP